MTKKEIIKMIIKHVVIESTIDGSIHIRVFESGIEALANEIAASVNLPTAEQVKEKCEMDINGFLKGNTEKELSHYRTAYRRSFEFIKRFIENKTK